MSEPVEGADYLFNRYAFLGVAPDADDDAILAAIRTKKSENHPDRHAHVSEEAQRAAKRNWAYTELCEEQLTDPTKRQNFDALLAYFAEHRPDVISASGSPIISLKYTRVSLQDLLGKMPSSDEHDKRVAQHVGFNPRSLTILERVYQADPTDPDAREAYREMLVKGIMHYDLLQDGVWEQAGVHIGESDRNAMRIHLDDISEGVHKRIAAIADSLPERVAQHVGLLESGLAKPLLLTHDGETQGSHPHESTALATHAADVVDAAKENLAKRTNRVKELAAKQQELTGKLLDTLETWPLSPDGVDTDVKRVCLMRQETPESDYVCMVTFVVNPSEGKLDLDVSLNGKTLEEIRQDSGTVTTTGIEMHNEVQDWPMYATYTYDKMQKGREVG